MIVLYMTVIEGKMKRKGNWPSACVLVRQSLFQISEMETTVWERRNKDFVFIVIKDL